MTSISHIRLRRRGSTKHRPRALASILLAAATSWWSSASWAQIDPMISSDMLNSTIQSMTSYNTMQATIEDTRRHDRETYLREARPYGRAGFRASGSADFDVGSDPRVSEEARRDFIGSIRRVNGERVASLIDAEFDRKDVRQAFREIAGPYGLRGDDYGDVFTAYMVTMWMVANRADAPAGEEVRAVSDQAHWVLEKGAMQRSRRERQRAAETMMYELVSAIYGKQEAERVGDVSTLDRMASLARRKFLHSGMDLTEMVLSSDGLVRR